MAPRILRYIQDPSHAVMISFEYFMTQRNATRYYINFFPFAVALAIRPVVDIVETPQTITTSNNRNRPPHPPIENRETDNEPRRGVFYIYTKYLSL